MSTAFLLSSLWLSLCLVSNSVCVVPKRRCPSNCRVNDLQRSSLDRLYHACPSIETFVKCSARLWLTDNGTLNVIFDGDSSAQAINESLNSNMSTQFLYHHTQVSFYDNVTETIAYVRHSCFDRDECSREFANKMSNLLLSYHYAELGRRIRPLIYDPTAKTEIQFLTNNLTCVVDNSETVAPCNTSCIYLSGISEVQRQCWPSTLVGVNIYTHDSLPVPINASISIDYSCNTRMPICNGPNVQLNVTTIVNDFFRNPPYIKPNGTRRNHPPGLAMFLILIFYLIAKS